MSKATGIEKYNKMVALHKENFIKKRDELNNDKIIDKLEREHAALFRKCTSGEITYDEYKRLSYETEQKKSERLSELGEDRNSMSYKYMCPECEDTGYLKGKVCSCLNKVIIECMYVDSGINKMLKKENFDTFNIDLFADKPYKQGEKSPRIQMKSILKYMKSYVDDFDNRHESFIFFGPTGTGKTFMAYCIAKGLIDKGYSVLFTSCHRMCTRLVDNQFGRINDSEVYGYTNCDLLIIDELGLEVSNDYASTQLYNIINERQKSAKKTIITTNYNISSMEDRYDERLRSRLSQYKYINFYGEDLRLKKTKLASKN